MDLKDSMWRIFITKKIICALMIISLLISIPFVAQKTAKTMKYSLVKKESTLAIKGIDIRLNAREELRNQGSLMSSVRLISFRRLSSRLISQVGYICRNLSLFNLLALILLLGIILHINNYRKIIIEYIHNKDGP